METLIEFESVSFGYRNDSTVIESVSLVLTPGEFVGLIGPNGSGKTTMIELAIGNRRPKTGIVHILGDDPSRLKPVERARRVSYLEQLPDRPGHSTVYDVILSGRRPYRGVSGYDKEDDEITLSAASYIGVSDWLGRRTSELSGGERQRVLLARVVAQEAPILLCDEPAASLDPKYRTEAFHLLKEIAKQKGRGVIASIHDINLAMAFCDRILLLYKRKIGFDGSPADLDIALLKEAYDIKVSSIATEWGRMFFFG